MYKKIILILFVFINSFVFAQQTSLFSLNQINPYLENPSFAGSNNNTNLCLLYRNQWMGFQGAPETSLFTIDGKIKGTNSGLGLYLCNDVVNIISQIKGYGTYSYNVKINSSHQLFFGLSAGFIQNQIYFDRINVQNINDLSLLSTESSKSGFNSDFGLHYKFRKLTIGATANQLFSGKMFYENQSGLQYLNYKLVRHYTADIQYNFSLSDSNLYLIPSLEIRGVQGAPVQYSIGLLTNWKEQFWAGTNFRQNYGAGIIVGMRLFNKLSISYAYDYPLGNIEAYTSGTHEVMLSFSFDEFSKINQSDNKTTNAKIKELEKLNQQQFEKIEELTQKNEVLTEKVERTEEEIISQKEEIERLNQSYNRDQETIDEIIKKYEFNQSDSSFNQNINNEVDTTSLIEYNELDKDQFYVIAGAYLNVDDAKLLQKILLRELKQESKVIAREDYKYFFVFTNSFATREEAETEIKSLYKNGIKELVSGKLWIYKTE
jgi:type IX secretion system PorP/SprF family membrane protein